MNFFKNSKKNLVLATVLGLTSVITSSDLVRANSVKYVPQNIASDSNSQFDYLSSISTARVRS